MAQQLISSTNQISSETVIQRVSQIVSNASSHQNIQNTLEKITQNIQGSNIFSFIPILLGALVVALFLYILLNRKKGGNQNVIALIGERYSGKTQLFIKINSGKSFQTVPSIKNNHTNFKSSSSNKNYHLTDYFGDNISKQEVLNPQNYISIHTIIQVIDGTDSTKLGDAALFIYRLLVSKSYQKRQCNYLIFLNKNDDKNFLTKPKIIKRLEDQIEHVKLSRKNSAEESEEEEDYLKASKQRFDLLKSGIKIFVGSAKQGDLKELNSVLQQIL